MFYSTNCAVKKDCVSKKISDEHHKANKMLRFIRRNMDSIEQLLSTLKPLYII